LKKVLVVDDHTIITQLLIINLSRADYNVFSACNGQEELETIKKTEPDIILLDIMMPIMNGLEMLEELRKTSDTPVIMMSAFGDGEEINKAREMGIECFLNKPFEMESLVNTLDLVLSL
jgi:DNA-binding response OmpR family regulator